MVSACGYDSIPAEFGVIHNTQQWEAPSVPNSVDSYLVLETTGKSIKGNIGTWESLVLGVANEANLQKLRKSRPRRSRPQVAISISFVIFLCDVVVWKIFVDLDCGCGKKIFYDPVTNIYDIDI